MDNQKQIQSTDASAERSSNFELLRIVAMLMIIYFHLIQHGAVVQLTDADSIALLQNGWFSHPVFYKRLWLITAAMPLGVVGNALFLMLSGYFLIQKKKVNLVKTAEKLLGHLAFAVVFLMVISAVWHAAAVKNGTAGVDMISLSNFNNGWWFIGYYFSVIVIGAVFLNHFLMGLDQKKYLAFLVTLFALVQFGWSGNLMDSLATGLRTLMTGIFLYAMGGFIHRFDPFHMVRTCVFYAAIVILNIMNLLSEYNRTESAIEMYLAAGNTEDYLQTVYEPENYDILVILLAVAVFEIFRRISIRNHKWINVAGSGTFMVYLIHENAFFRSLYRRKDFISILYNDPCMFVLRMTAWTLAAFACGLAVYFLYMGCIRVFYYCRDKSSC